MELGLATFADWDPARRPEQRMRNLLEGRSSPTSSGWTCSRSGSTIATTSRLLPGGGAGGDRRRTERIRLSSAVTVLSLDDPVRVFQQFAHVDLISGGPPNHGGPRLLHRVLSALRLRPDDYDELYAEKLELLLAIRDSTHVAWWGRHRASLDDAGVWPRPLQDPLPVWVTIGTPNRWCGPARSACR